MKNPPFTWEPGDQSEERISWRLLLYQAGGGWCTHNFVRNIFLKLHPLADGLPAIRQPTPAETDI
jgi:hypothetical protein